ncbi:MAG: hypothetical protein J6B72_00035 [Clostridia bacterium]|nr:hypothetical protein [Clostridia bacterium]
MKTVELTEKEIVEGDMTQRCRWRGAGVLGKGRSPFAFADILGEDGHTDIKGRASFYYTPLGMLVCASVKGLDGKRRVYSLSLVSDNEGTRDTAMQCAIPPLYERNGYAWCSALTGKISPCEIIGRRIAMREMGNDGKRGAVASGVVRCCDL